MQFETFYLIICRLSRVNIPPDAYVKSEESHANKFSLTADTRHFEALNLQTVS